MSGSFSVKISNVWKFCGYGVKGGWERRLVGRWLPLGRPESGVRVSWLGDMSVHAEEHVAVGACKKAYRPGRFPVADGRAPRLPEIGF